MISAVHCLLCASVTLLLWTSVGFAVARRVLPGQKLAMAPALGYALFNAVALPLCAVVGVTPLAARLVLAVALLSALLSIARNIPDTLPPRPIMPAPALMLAALLALVPMLAVLPKSGALGIDFAIQIFDHSKVALIDQITRSGVPPTNPFYGATGGPQGVAYYYLWHFGAALIAAACGATGWEADIALTWATAFASLTLMMAMVLEIGGRRAGVWWVLLLCSALSLRPFLIATICGYDFANLITGYPGLQGWLAQASWVPQHLAAADCLCLMLLLLARLGQARDTSAAIAVSLAVVTAAGFESSTYVGGILPAVAAPLLGAVLLATLDRTGRRTLLLYGIGALLVTLALIAPFLRDQLAGTAARAIGMPVDFTPFEVFGPVLPERLRRLLDLPGYWLVQLPVDLPAIYFIGLWSLGKRMRSGGDLSERLLAVLALVGLATAWLLVSTIANNDLGWRAILPAAMVLTVFAAMALAGFRWRSPVPWLLLLPVALGLFGGASYFRENWQGRVDHADPDFAASREMWSAVRHASLPSERVVNNPDSFADLLPWPINLSWALLADRPSCFAGHELVLAYVALPTARQDEVADLFRRVFDGSASAADVDSLAGPFNCRVIVLTRRDGAWAKDPFAGNRRYRLVDQRDDNWRIYRADEPSP